MANRRWAVSFPHTCPETRLVTCFRGGVQIQHPRETFISEAAPESERLVKISSFWPLESAKSGYNCNSSKTLFLFSHLFRHSPVLPHLILLAAAVAATACRLLIGGSHPRSARRLLGCSYPPPPHIRGLPTTHRWLASASFLSAPAGHCVRHGSRLLRQGQFRLPSSAITRRICVASWSICRNPSAHTGSTRANNFSALCMQNHGY
jgi:hypothetical protein